MKMTTDNVMLFVTFVLVADCSGLVISAPTSAPMLGKMDEITRHLQDLTKSMAELDTELQEAVLMRGVKDGVAKRSSSRDEADVSCRLHLHEDMCQVLEILHERTGHRILQDPTTPGKRSGDGPAPNYRKLASDLRQKREMVHTLTDVFNNAAYIMEREKKWLTCNLNLGFTCQTQEYSNIADYYDFLNSADSPGKKRSVPDDAQPLSSKS